jgi:hypothetical protein
MSDRMAHYQPGQSLRGTRLAMGNEARLAFVCRDGLAAQALTTFPGAKHTVATDFGARKSP